MRLAGSRAREAFAGALEELHRFSLAHPGSRPALAFDPLELGPVPAEPVRPSAQDGRAPRPTGRRTIATAAEEIAVGRTTSWELVEEALAAVAEHDGALHAVAELNPVALAEAEQRDRELAGGLHRGPLHGIPVTVKDVIDVAGLPTRAGSAAYDDVPGRDATAVARLREAGAVILGKVTTHEFALGVTTPQSRNPFDRSRIPGGSSGGSAIAVATGMGLGSLGTDTRASIRVPAALCGVVGFKPTFGTVPTDGVVPLSWTMDHVAPMARTVEDAAILLDALTGSAGRYAGWLGLATRGLRIGVPPAAFLGADPEVVAPVTAAIGALEPWVGSVAEIDRPSAQDFAIAGAAGLVVSRCEAAAFHRALGADRRLYWDEVADQLDAGEHVSAVDYLDAQRVRRELGASLLGLFDVHDVLAMPTTLVAAPPAEDFARHLLSLARNAIPWSFLGFPAVSVPCGTTAAGLPVGLQLVAPPRHEGLLVAVAGVLEQAVAG